MTLTVNESSPTMEESAKVKTSVAVAAAGAVVAVDSADRARRLGLAPEAYLENNDAYTFFDELGDLVRTGPTGTNVGDVQVVLTT